MAAATFACTHEGCGYTSNHAGHFIRHIATRHAEAGAEPSTQEALGLELVKHLMQRVIALEARLLPQADVDQDSDGDDPS